MKKLCNVFLGVILLVLCVGCQDESITTQVQSVVNAQASVEETASEKVEETASEKVEEQNEVSESYTITDMAGREVVIPSTINKAFSVNNNGTILLYTLAPDKMMGWNAKHSESGLKYLDSEAAKLPALGTLYGNSTQINLEEIIALDPDILIFMNTTMSEKVITAADELQERLSTPVVMIKGDLESYDKSYEFMGELLNMEEEAGKLATYYRETYDAIAAMKSKISEEDRVRVYYARGDNGLTTEVQGSSHAVLIDMVGAINVVKAESLASEKPKVSMEQVMELNPQAILVGSDGFAKTESIKAVNENNVGWGTLDAVKNDAIYVTPTLPFGWFDRPPSVNRIIGMRWLMWRLYPEVYEGDIEADVKEFYELFYHVSLTDEDVEQFIGR